MSDVLLAHCDFELKCLFKDHIFIDVSLLRSKCSHVKCMFAV